MDELDLGDFTYGGVNITGFTLVDPSVHPDVVPQRSSVPSKLTVSKGRALVFSFSTPSTQGCSQEFDVGGV